MVGSIFPISFYARSCIVTVNDRPEIFLKAVVFHEPQIFSYKRARYIVSFNDIPLSCEDQICSHVFKHFVNCQEFWQYKAFLFLVPCVSQSEKNPLTLPEVKYISIYAFHFVSISYTGTHVLLMLTGFIFMNYSFLMN